MDLKRLRLAFASAATRHAHGGIYISDPRRNLLRAQKKKKRTAENDASAE
jgi:hypothetical protein